METPTPPQTPVLQWQAPRVANHERSARWYLIGGVIVIGGAVFGLISGDWSLSIVSLLCGAVYFLVRDHKFPEITCVLSDVGVQINETFMPWSQTKGYWFVSTPTFTELHVTPKAKHASDLTIQTGSIQPMEIRVFLAGKTDELTDKQESLLDILVRLFKL